MFVGRDTCIDETHGKERVRDDATVLFRNNAWDIMVELETTPDGRLAGGRRWKSTVEPDEKSGLVDGAASSIA